MRRLFSINRINNLTRKFSCLFHSFKIRLIALLDLFTAHNDRLSLSFQMPDAGKRYLLESGASPYRGIPRYREYLRDPFASKEVPTYLLWKLSSFSLRHPPNWQLDVRLLLLNFIFYFLLMVMSYMDRIWRKDNMVHSKSLYGRFRDTSKRGLTLQTVLTFCQEIINNVSDIWQKLTVTT